MKSILTTGGAALYFSAPALLYLIFGLDIFIVGVLIYVAILIRKRRKEEEMSEPISDSKEVDYNALVAEAIEIANDPVKSEKLLGKPPSIESNYYYWYSMGGQLGTMGKLKLSEFCFNAQFMIIPP